MCYRLYHARILITVHISPLGITEPDSVTVANICVLSGRCSYFHRQSLAFACDWPRIGLLCRVTVRRKMSIPDSSPTNSETILDVLISTGGHTPPECTALYRHSICVLRRKKYYQESLSQSQTRPSSPPSALWPNLKLPRMDSISVIPAPSSPRPRSHIVPTTPEQANTANLVMSMER